MSIYYEIFIGISTTPLSEDFLSKKKLNINEAYAERLNTGPNLLKKEKVMKDVKEQQ